MTSKIEIIAIIHIGMQLQVWNDRTKTSVTWIDLKKLPEVCFVIKIISLSLEHSWMILSVNDMMADSLPVSEWTSVIVCYLQNDQKYREIYL